MKKGEETRARLLEAAADELRRRGYHGTGLSRIIAASGAPRGSLYFHFPGGKSELAVAALAAAGARWRADIEAVIEAAPDPAAAAVAVGEHLAAQLEDSDFADGCPAATVALEVAADSEPLRAECDRLYRGWESLISDQAVRAGLPAEAADAAARFALCAFEGALLVARVRRSGEPLREVGRTLATMLRGGG